MSEPWERAADAWRPRAWAAPGEHIRVRTSLRVARWDEEQTRRAARHYRLDPEVNSISPAMFAALGIAPYSVTTDRDCNLVTEAGWTAVLGGIAGTTMTNKFSATNGRIGIGTSTTAATYSDTALGGDTGSGSTTSYYQLVNGVPAISVATSPPTLTFQAVFGPSVANFAWEEFGTDNYTASGVTTTGLGAGYFLFNHGISNQSAKVSGQTFTATESMTWGYTAVIDIS